MASSTKRGVDDDAGGYRLKQFRDLPKEDRLMSKFLGHPQPPDRRR